MAITAKSVKYSGYGNTWIAEYTSDGADPLFRLYVNGQLRRITRSNHFAFTGGHNAYTTFEVRDDDLTPQQAAEGFVNLTWLVDADAQEFQIERFVGAAWVLIETVWAVGSQYTYRTSHLGGTATAEQFRVTPIGVNGNEGTAFTPTFELVMFPDPPDVDFAYDEGTDTVTITAA